MTTNTTSPKTKPPSTHQIVGFTRKRIQNSTPSPPYAEWPLMMVILMRLSLQFSCWSSKTTAPRDTLASTSMSASKINKLHHSDHNSASDTSAAFSTAAVLVPTVYPTTISHYCRRSPPVMVENKSASTGVGAWVAPQPPRTAYSSKISGLIPAALPLSFSTSRHRRDIFGHGRVLLCVEVCSSRWTTALLDQTRQVSNLWIFEFIFCAKYTNNCGLLTLNILIVCSQYPDTNNSGLWIIHTTIYISIEWRILMREMVLLLA